MGKKKDTKRKRISVSSAKSKGRELQKWTAEKISDITGIKCGKDELISSRGGGQSGTDIVLIGKAQKLFPYAVECKRTEKLDLYGSIRQAEANQKEGTDWLLVSRRSQEKAIVTMDAEAFFKLVKDAMPKVGYFHKEVTYDKNGIVSPLDSAIRNNPNFSGDVH